MDLNLLHVFRAIYREKNLTRAAECLGISPAGASAALRRLREELFASSHAGDVISFARSLPAVGNVQALTHPWAFCPRRKARIFFGTPCCAEPIESQHTEASG